MSLPGSPRRDQRRRLLVSWTRRKSPAASADSPAGRSIADYAAEALPERQPAIATLLPTSLAGLAIAATVILLALGSTMVIGGYEPALATVERTVGGRFAHTVAAVRSCFDGRSAISAAGWMSQLLLTAAAVVAAVVRLMRRHRRDDYRGRYRAWGWLAGLLLTASAAAQFPLGRFVGTFLAEATGIAFGPQGFGWWVTLATVLFAVVSMWAVLPLHERLTTALCFATALAAWGVAAAGTWIGNGRDAFAITTHAAWALGSGLMTIAVLAAARSVIREVRGETGRVAKPRKQPDAAQTAARTAAAAAAQPLHLRHEQDRDEPTTTEDDESDGGYTSGDFTDGSDAEDDRATRHLSKAERKRLKKLARLNRVA